MTASFTLLYSLFSLVWPYLYQVRIPGPGGAGGGGGSIPGILTHTLASGNGNRDTPEIDTNGATGLYLVVVSYGSTINTSGFTDKIANSATGNSWYQWQVPAGSGTSKIAVFTCFSCTVGAQHKVSFTAGTGYYESIYFGAFSTATWANQGAYGVPTTYSLGQSVYDASSNIYMSTQNGNTGHTPASSPTYWAPQYAMTGSTATTNIQSGPLTPVNNGSLLFTGFVSNGNSLAGITIDNGFTIIDSTMGVSTGMAGGVAVLTQASAAAINPQWSPSGGTGNPGPAAAVLAFFNQ